jgi:hypothetical protein
MSKRSERDDVKQLISEGYTVCIAAGTDLGEDGEPLTYKISVLDSNGQKVAESQSHLFEDAMTEVYCATPETSQERRERGIK